MGLFDFISGDEFRMGLEQDFAELSLAMESKSWKSVHGAYRRASHFESREGPRQFPCDPPPRPPVESC